MAITPAVLKRLVAEELELLGDSRAQAHVRSLLIEPDPVLRDWDYRKPAEKYLCWTVLSHSPSNTGIAYCEEGFGPKRPWGLVHLSGDDGMSIGMDSGWFSTFLDAFFDSFAATDLPIWRIFRTTPEGERIPISPEVEWAAAWRRIEQLRREDPSSRYECDHSIAYGRTRET